VLDARPLAKSVRALIFNLEILMNKFYFTIILSILSFTSIAETRDENEIVWADKEDPVMVSAIKKARSTLKGFLDRYVSNIPNVADYKLKVMIEDANGVEHFWVQPFRPAKNGGFEGILANEPRIVKSVKYGEIVSFNKDMITDWGYVENGKQYGSYTICALFQSMPKDQVEYYRKNHGFQC